VVEHASTRQPFIDQGQSVNVFVNPTITKNELHQLHKQAWEKGLKALYYCRTESVGSTANISKELDWGTPVEPKVTFSETSSECLSCEG
jgi:ribonucleoside-diphosphate reductase alpha chain